MFRDHAQTHAAIRALLLVVPDRDRWWTEAGPTSAAVEVIEGLRGPPLTQSQMLLVKVAGDLWNGRGYADFGRMLNTLDNETLGAIGALLVAITQGPLAVDRWIYGRCLALGAA